MFISLCKETCSSCWQSYYLKGNIAWHWLMSRRYLIAIENNKMFVAWWMNPFNIDMKGVATLTPSSYFFCFLNISFLCLESYYFFYIICSFGGLF